MPIFDSGRNVFWREMYTVFCSTVVFDALILYLTGRHRTTPLHSTHFPHHSTPHHILHSLSTSLIVDITPLIVHITPHIVHIASLHCPHYSTSHHTSPLHSLSTSPHPTPPHRTLLRIVPRRISQLKTTTKSRTINK